MQIRFTNKYNTENLSVSSNRYTNIAFAQKKSDVVDEYNNQSKRIGSFSDFSRFPLQIFSEIELTKLLLNLGILTKPIKPKDRSKIKQIVKENLVNATKNCEIIKQAMPKCLVNADPERKRIYFDQISDVLLNKQMTPDVINELISINEQRKISSTYSKNQYTNCAIYNFEKAVRLYDEIDSISTVKQKELTDILLGKLFLTSKEIENLSKESPLMKFSLIKDFKELGFKSLIEKISNSRTHSIVSSIEVDNNIIQNFDEIIEPSKLKNALNSTDLTKYQKGFPLQYPRKNFISDFKKLIKPLSQENQKKLYSLFHFSIDENDDIIRYPNSKNPLEQNIPSELQSVYKEATKLVNSFMLDNKVCLENSDKQLENVLNDIFKLFPELLPLVGKIQHRGDSLDFHVFDDLKKSMNDSRYDSLNREDKRVLNLAILFHDYTKPQNKVDVEHPLTSSYFAKDIIKKLPITSEEKERIVNLIKYSHWNTSNLTEQDLALAFRRPNDYKLAQIFALADGKSAGFNPSIKDLDNPNIQNYIDTINSTAIPLFVDFLPNMLSNFEVTNDGYEYLDFSDLNTDISKYGFKQGTKVKDLNFLFHSSSEPIRSFSLLCDDSENIALSTVFLPFSEVSSAHYNNSPITYLLNASNSNIIVAGKEVGGTGMKKDSEYFKRLVYPDYQNPDIEEDNDDFFDRDTTLSKHRTGLSSEIKQKLMLNDNEYSEFYSLIYNLHSISEIKDIELSNGKKLKREDIMNTLNEVRNNMLNARPVYTYKNEVVVYKPKIDAIVISKKTFFDTNSDGEVKPELDDAKKISKERHIPIILR